MLCTSESISDLAVGYARSGYRCFLAGAAFFAGADFFAGSDFLCTGFTGAFATAFLP